MFMAKVTLLKLSALLDLSNYASDGVIKSGENIPQLKGTPTVWRLLKMGDCSLKMRLSTFATICYCADECLPM